MAGLGSGAAPRWWRRDADAARRRAAAAREAAAAAMLELDAALSDLPDAVAVAEERAEEAARDTAAAPRGGRAHHDASAPDSLTRDWRDLSAHADAVIGHYLQALSNHDADAATESGPARAATAELGRAADALREVLAQVLRFREQYGAALTAASSARAGAGRTVSAARDAVATARAALDEAAAAGLADPALDAALAGARAAAATAEAELAARRAGAAGTAAEEARRTAASVAERARALPGRAADVRRGAASVHTRREALGTRHERLAPVMSELRRRYPLSAWADVERAPQRAAEALREVDAALAGLDDVLAARVLDVPAAAALLARVRTAAGRVDDEVRAATGRLEQLDAVAADPRALLTDVQRALVDARRFLAGLPEERARRFRRTFEELARRLPPLEEAARAERPDVGAVLREATSIERGLAGLVRTARAD
ncbi:hypothetical protein SAMN05660464_3229 [Geodermatophilus dictyosporus]|uniref:Uncharacterized protein n=1 Tax=Geodermatophilus dictyosporus TaxID=1523247 RepID=A0A1I5QN11_9ACTN|nr:hypothetical protein [Geodermatophilus dictyosporus]SFP47480.1 hypothetical protein SAMN05660464_3229 [Geodermatophilus dictyosporus]